MGIRHFTDKNGNRYEYDPNVPELVSEESMHDTGNIYKYGLETVENTFSVTFTSTEEKTSPENIDDLLNAPVREAYATADFWKKRTTEEWLRVLIAKKDYLFDLYAPKNFWEKLKFGDKIFLFKMGREDLVTGHYQAEGLTANELKWHANNKITSLIACITVAVSFFILSLLCGASHIFLITGSTGNAILGYLYWHWLSRSYFMNKKQALVTGITGGFCFSAIFFFALLQPSLYLIFAIPGVIFGAGIVWGFLQSRKPVIDCRQCCLKNLCLPIISFSLLLMILIIWGISIFYPACCCRDIARNFRISGLHKAEQLYMTRFIAQHNQYGKKIDEFRKALEKNNYSDALSAFEALVDIWNTNPALSKLISEYTATIQKQTITPEQGNIDDLVRARKIFSMALEKDLSTLIDLELDLRHKQLSQELKNYRKISSPVATSALFNNYAKKIAAIEKLDKNYAALISLKIKNNKITTSYFEELHAKISCFEKEFDKRFPPEKYVADFRKKIPEMNEIYQGFPHSFTENSRLKYAWWLILIDRKNGLSVLKQWNQGKPAFLFALVNNGISPERFSESCNSNIFQTLTIRKPVEAEHFFRFLLDQYNFKPEILTYLIALSEKAQKKNYTQTLETAILNKFPDQDGFYLTWVPINQQKIQVLEQIVKSKMYNWKIAAVNLGKKYFDSGNFSKSFDFYRLAGDMASTETGRMNEAYYKTNKDKIKLAVRKFILEFDRVYSNSTSAAVPVDFEFNRCLNWLENDFIWRYAFSCFQHSKISAVRNEARALLVNCKMPEAIYLLAKIDNLEKELPQEAVQAGSVASFRKIRLEATRYKLLSSRFSSREKLDGIKFLFEEGELSLQEKLYAGTFLMKQNDLMNARKIFDSLPASKDKFYRLFLCDLASGNKTSAQNNLAAALEQGYPVPYHEYTRLVKTTDIKLMKMLVNNKGNGYRTAALELARLMAASKEWPEAAKYFKLADVERMTAKDKEDYGFALWECGDKSSLCYELCLKLPDERIGADLAWHIYLYLRNKKDIRTDIWLKTAAEKGSPDAENERFLILRQDDSDENSAEKNKLWKNCLQRGFKEAVLDAVDAAIMESPYPVSKETLIRCGELFYNKLSDADKKKFSNIKEKLEGLKEL